MVCELLQLEKRIQFGTVCYGLEWVLINLRCSVGQKDMKTRKTTTKIFFKHQLL